MRLCTRPRPTTATRARSRRSSSPPATACRPGSRHIPEWSRTTLCSGSRAVGRSPRDTLIDRGRGPSFHATGRAERGRKEGVPAASAAGVVAAAARAADRAHTSDPRLADRPRGPERALAWAHHVEQDASWIATPGGLWSFPGSVRLPDTAVDDRGAVRRLVGDRRRCEALDAELSALHMYFVRFFIEGASQWQRSGCCPSLSR